MSRRRIASWLAVAAGAALAVTLLLVAEPASVLALAGSVTWRWLAVAFAWTVLVLLARGLRLSLVSGGRLSGADGVAVIAVAQFAGAALPMRLGEVVLFLLLQTAGLQGAVRSASFVVLLRALDVGALLAWALVVGAWLGARSVLTAAGLALAVLLLALVLIRVLDVPKRLVRLARRHAGWRRKAVRQALRVRHELRVVARSPWRAASVVALSLLAWAGIWGLTVALMRGMGQPWPAPVLLVGVVGASLGAAVPINAMGNFGTQEAGWTAALAGLGVPASDALAAGFASHLWSLVFGFVLCLGGVAYMALLRHRGGEAVPGGFAEALRRAWRRDGSAE